MTDSTGGHSAMINERVKSQRRNRIFYKVSEYLPTKNTYYKRIKKKLYSEKNLASLPQSDRI